MIIYHATLDTEINGTNFYSVISTNFPGQIIGVVSYSKVLGFTAYTTNGNSEVKLGNAASLAESLELFAKAAIKKIEPASEVIDITNFTAADIGALLAPYAAAQSRRG